MNSSFNYKILAHEQGKRLKYLREITRLSRRAFAFKHGFPPGTLQNWEEGRYERGINQKAALTLIVAFQAESIDCQVDWLLYGEGLPPKHQFAHVQKIIAPDIIEAEKKSDETTLLQQAVENEKRHKSNANLFDAAANGRYREIVNLIESGVDAHLYEGLKVKPYESEHNTPLHLASLNGHLDIVKYLIKKGANVNTRNRKNQMPLHLAVHNAHKEIIKYLVKHGADMNVVEDEGDTPVAWAAYKGQTEIVLLLIELGARIDIQNKAGNTPLHWAAEKGDLDVTKVLIANGANLTVKNYENNTPLLAATQNGHIETVKFLLKQKFEK